MGDGTFFLRDPPARRDRWGFEYSQRRTTISTEWKLSKVTTKSHTHPTEKNEGKGVQIQIKRETRGPLGD